jgi:hypothetical protein
MKKILLYGRINSKCKRKRFKNLTKKRKVLRFHSKEKENRKNLKENHLKRTMKVQIEGH